MNEYQEKVTVFYEVEDEGRVTHSLSMSLEKPGGMKMDEFHRFLKRFAIACGYSPNLVEEYFGEDQYEI